jgi:hypothetical protein
MTDAIFGIRQDVLKRRLSGGHNILWSAKDAARIRQHVWELSEKNLFRVAELPDSQGPVTGPMGAMVLRAMDPAALSWQFQITNETPDLCADIIKVAGWNLKNFKTNGPVLDSHNSAIPPLGACPNNRCSILSESDSTLGHEQVFSPLEYRSDTAAAAECAGLRAERPCLAVYR